MAEETSTPSPSLTIGKSPEEELKKKLNGALRLKDYAPSANLGVCFTNYR